MSSTIPFSPLGFSFNRVVQISPLAIATQQSSEEGLLLTVLQETLSSVILLLTRIKTLEDCFSLCPKSLSPFCLPTVTTTVALPVLFWAVDSNFSLKALLPLHPQQTAMVTLVLKRGLIVFDETKSQFGTRNSPTTAALEFVLNHLASFVWSNPSSETATYRMDLVRMSIIHPLLKLLPVIQAIQPISETTQFANDFGLQGIFRRDIW